MDGKNPNEALRYELRGDVALLVMGLAPINALTAELRRALSAGLDQAIADPSVRAVVICSDLASFSAGSDVSDHGKIAGQTLFDLCQRIEASPKPVVAALNGKVLGAGLELALAAHGRIGGLDAMFGLPDVALGSVPGAGGTQRLTRLVGAQSALRLLLDPVSISVSQALSIGLIDEVAEADLREASIHAAVHLAQAPQVLRGTERRDGLRDGKAFHAAIVAARAKVANSFLLAPHRAIDCVEAAQLLLPDQALAFEAAAHQELINGAQALGLRHQFFAERRAAMPPHMASLPRASLSYVAIWGAGEGMAELVVQALGAGLRVSIVDASREALKTCLSQIATLQERAVVEARQTPQARDADWARLQTSMTPEILAEADLIFAGPDAGPVPLNAASSVYLGVLPRRAAVGRVAVLPAKAAGLAAEVCLSAEASASLTARIVELARMLHWRLVFTEPGGAVDARLRNSLSSAIAELEAKGVGRTVIATALASYGIGVGARAQLPDPPPETPGILQACTLALINEGTKLLAEKVVRWPSDIDVVAVLAGIFPRWQGGPMFQADTMGLLVLRSELQKRAKAAPQIFEPDPLLDRLISDGMNFSALNRTN